ncbi:unnamed protein product [Paramecium octaurelia]|uniref:Uncharacterized protein n=1 Tax=Paramecium octaurelia TaxID=43137 RepID=A0A8S1XM53_PAROT|nr:unnamed protein product [Paramecium octaurelia]
MIKKNKYVELIYTLRCKLNANQLEAKNLFKAFLNYIQVILVKFKKSILKRFTQEIFKFTNARWYHDITSTAGIWMQGFPIVRPEQE